MIRVSMEIIKSIIRYIIMKRKIEMIINNSRL